eukprot:TRINITY_DN6670_c0_g1_i5.p1 TRINITY_DN6670_c0_g1~~TRINITY_DN6670_c0_g1_i5.p1  ORF type:complete len:265 (-),score=60.79 TRINITY_DN6670_c0_g1_i5:11-805(-)
MDISKLFSLEGKTALITGSTQGLGFYIAEVLASAGANVVINGRFEDKTQAAAKNLREKIEKLENLKTKPKIHPVAADVAKVDDIQKLVSATLETFGRVDILVNNAGIIVRGKFEEYDSANWHKIIDLNLNSVFYLTQLCGRDMLKRQWGRVIHLGSIHSFVSMPERVAYASTKGALLQFGKSLALEWADKGITVNSICPGIFKTPINESWMADPEKSKDMMSKIPMKRWGEAKDIYGLALLLASDAGSYITGTGYLVDGGYTAQ